MGEQDNLLKVIELNIVNREKHNMRQGLNIKKVKYEKFEENGIPSFLEEGEELMFVTELNDVSLVGSEED